MTARTAPKLPVFPEFTPLMLAQEPLIKAEHSVLFPPYSDHTFASLWCWNPAAAGSPGCNAVSTLRGNLVLRLTDYFTRTPFLTFFGRRQVGQTLRELLAYCEDHGPCPAPPLRLVPEHILQGVALPDDVVVETERDNWDYVYATAQLAAMRGTPYQAHRNFINRFTKQYRWNARQLDLHRAEDLTAVRHLLAVWSANKLADGMAVDVDLCALGLLTALLGTVDFLGIGIYVDDNLAAYTINELQWDGYATNLFEHADTQYVGIFRVLKQQTAVHLLARGYRYWNHQQDSGFPGLRKSKESFHPEFYLKKSSIMRRPDRGAGQSLCAER